MPPERVRYTWIPRAQNAHADRLANEAMDAAAQGRPWRRRAVRPAGPDAEGTSAGADDGGDIAPSSTRAPVDPDLGEPTTLVLVRHGRTQHTEQRRFSGGGGADPDLSPAGRGDADEAARAVALLGGPASFLPDVGAADVLLSSPMARCRQTASALAQRCALAPVVDEPWVEAGFGQWDGLTMGEVARRWPEELGRWRGSTAARPPGGESLDEVVARVRAARARIVARHPGLVVVVVTHVTPVRVVVQEALEAGPSALWRLRVDPCSLTAVRFWGDGGAEVLGVNATGHLVGS
jgi:probable phosphoglycerate mutase